MRVRRFVVHPQALVRLFTMPVNSWFRHIVSNPLPADVELVRMYDTFDGRTVLVVRSEEFDDVADGAVIPEHPTPLFEIQYPKGLTE